MSHDSKTGIHVEKGFSRYVHACLYHASRDFLGKQIGTFIIQCH